VETLDSWDKTVCPLNLRYVVAKVKVRTRVDLAGLVLLPVVVGISGALYFRVNFFKIVL
jgi:hypothetical protein